MSIETKESGEQQIRAKAAPKARKSSAKTTTASAKSKTPGAKKKAAGSKTKPGSPRTGLSPRGGKTPATKARKPKAKPAKEPAAGYSIGEPVLDPIGDVSSGEARFLTRESAEFGPETEAEMAAYRAETEAEAVGGTLEATQKPSTASAQAEPASAQLKADESAAGSSVAGENEFGLQPQPRPEAKLERLQKILSQAGVASRRHAEEMIVAGRVMVNGQIVTQLGSKADPARDHIRVDGKLLHGAERHRYFILNKPKGYVTTVSDPEGRPTVMEFFAKMSERLYPVGRLDYQSEGLLLMTNDGELANRLSKAGSGVEKTYVIKVAGQPSEEELDRLQGGVAIERGQAGSPKVRTAPARVRQLREGDNPWYEVVLIEGRNRELRKMFAAIGHFVEKIRRVGYGPLALDIEPGEFRELTADEVAALRLAAEGKLKPRSRTQTGFRAAGGGSRAAKPAKMPPQIAAHAAAQRFAKQGFAKQPPTREEKPPWKKHGSRERNEWEPREQRLGANAERPQHQRAAKPGLRRPQGEWANARPKFGQQQGERFGPRSRFGGPQKERAAGKPGRFGTRPAERLGTRPTERRPFRDQPEVESGPRTRFERQSFAGRPRQTDQGVSFEESPRGAFRRHGEQQDRAQEHGFQKPARPEKPFGKAPGRPFGKGSGKNRAGKPEGSWNQAAGKRSGRREGSAPAFRGKGPAGGFPRSGFKAKPGGSKPGGFLKSGYKGTPAGAGRNGPRPPGQRRGGKRRG